MSASAPSVALSAARTPASTGARLWAFLSSVKLGVFLIAVLTLAAITGTVVESRWDTPTAQRWVYHSLWFCALMVALALNLVAATWRTTLHVLRLPWTRPLLTRAEDFEGLADQVEIARSLTLDQVRAAMERQVGKTTGEGPALFAQAGIIQRWGSLITHAGILLLLGGGVYLSVIAHWSGGPGGTQLWIGEGLTQHRYLAPDPQNPQFSTLQPLPFEIRLLDFDADYFPHTMVPQAFTSTVELITPDGHRSIRRVNMNEALTWNGWKFSQASFTILDDSMPQADGNRFYTIDGQPFVDLLEQGRAAVELTDTLTPRVHPVFDAALGVPVPVPHSDLMFEMAEGGRYRVLRGETEIASGTLEGASAGGDYAVRIDAFYPHYFHGPAGDATLDAQMVNPAIRWTLLRGGRELGSDLSFGAEAHRGMRFADLPVRATFTGWEPAGLAEWRTGEPIELRVEFTVEATGVAVDPGPLAIGTEVPLGAEAASAEAQADSAFTARLVGRLPAAYTMLSVMREPAGLKAFFYLSFLLFLGGPFLAFATSHRQVWAWVDPAGKRVLIGGRARGRREALAQTLRRLQHDLEARPQ